MTEFHQYSCNDCDYIYDEEKGDPENGIVPGTLWRQLPDDWICPQCGSPKSDFSVVI